MRDVFFAFYGEDKADYEFLLRVIERYLKKLLPETDFNSIRVPKIEAENEIERQRKLAEEYAGLHFMIIHRDADAPSEDKALEKHFIPEAERKKKKIVPIIPIKETEAWILADVDAFKKVIATNLGVKELGFPVHPHQVEKFDEPKEVINTAISRARPQRKRISIDEIYEAMGESISLEQLEKVPAFQDFRKRISEILNKLDFHESE